MINYDVSWESFSAPLNRNLKNTIQNETVATKLLKHFPKIFAEEPYFDGKSIEWKNGYLLYGVPGSRGTIRGLVNQYSLDLFNVNLPREPMKIQKQVSSGPSEAIRMVQKVFKRIHSCYG